MLSPVDLQQLARLPEKWRYTPVNGKKAPYLRGWERKPVSKQYIGIIAQRHRKCHAIGLLLGELSGGLLSLDHDGDSCDPLIEKLAGVTVQEALPTTVGFSSGKLGRYQLLYQVPEMFRPYISSKVVLTRVKDSNGKDEQLDCRWSGKQSVILGRHPETGSYHWLPGQSPWEVEVAQCPPWVVRQILSFYSLRAKNRKEWTDRDWALSYLEWIPNADLDWYQWRNILLALHHAGVEEELARVWSATSDKHTDKELDSVWRHIDDNCDNPLTVAYLGQLAQENGWKGKSAHTLDRDDTTQEIADLIQIAAEDIQTKEILHEHLREPFGNIAQRLGVPIGCILINFLPVAASLLHYKSVIEVDSSTQFYPKNILWTAQVGDSGSIKTPLIKLIVNPIRQLQKAAYDRYQAELEDYQQALEEWKTQEGDRGSKPQKPAMRHYYFDDATPEAIFHQLSLQANKSVIIAKDELAGFIRGFDQYKSKGGNERQRWLSAYDDGVIKIDRKGAEPIFMDACISLMGGIQPSTLKRLMGDLNEIDGFWPRFMFARVPLTQMPPPMEGVRFDVSQRLQDLYQKLSELEPTTYVLSAQTKQIWNDWHISCEKQKLQEPHPAVRAIYPKAKERAARIALILHCVNALLGEQQPTKTVNADTLKSAITFTHWGIDQTRLIYGADLEASDRQISLIVRFVERFRYAGWIATRQVRNWYSAKEKPSAEDCRKFMSKIVSLGYALDNGEQGTGYQIKIIDTRSPSSPKTPPPQTQQGVSSSPSSSLLSSPSSPVQSQVRESILEPLPDICKNESWTRDGRITDYKADYIQNQPQQEVEAQGTKWTTNNNIENQQPKVKASDYWRTPDTPEQPILTLVSQVLDGIGLDPTANDAKLVSARYHFTAANNCLNHSWEGLGSVFMNPPYSKPLPFIQKLVAEYKLGHIPEAIALLKVGTIYNKGTGSAIWSSAGAIVHWGCGKASRIAFLNEDGIPVKGADFDCVLIYWGSRTQRFKEAFEAYGNVTLIEAGEQGNKATPISEPPDHPRNACTVQDGRIEVDLNKLSLDYRSEITIPSWQPSTQLKPYESLSKLYLDIETSGLDPECNRVLMVGFLDEAGNQTILTNQDEKQLLGDILRFLRKNQPQLLIGHNLFKFDLPFLMQRWKYYQISHPFRLDNKPRIISASSFQGKPIEFRPVRWSGTQIIDTFQQACIWDKSAAKLTSYNLKSCCLTLGLRKVKRLELSADEIQAAWNQGDTGKIAEYLAYDLEDTQLLANYLLPIVYYQLAIVPDISLQDVAVASPALKAQKIHEALIPKVKPQPDRALEYRGALISCTHPGLHRQVAKIDVTSLYPSIMLRFGICSHKDPQHQFLGVMQYMTSERLKLKQLAKSGNIQAGHEQNALKILLNGSYGFLGTKGYSFNDYTAAALVTAYGRKILMLMENVVTTYGGALIESDTDGIIFSHPEPQQIAAAVQQTLPEGINVELEFSDCGIYIPKAKSYVIVHPDGKTTIKGLFRKRDRYPLEKEFPVGFLQRYFQESPQSAEHYYHHTREAIAARQIAIEQLTVTRKIGAAETRLVKLRLGKPGEVVSFYYTQQKRFHARSQKPLPSVAIEVTSGDYWVEWYLTKLDRQYQEITGTLPQSAANEQLTLLTS